MIKHTKTNEHDAKISDEWKSVALVLDRVFFCITIICVIAICIAYLRVPPEEGMPSVEDYPSTTRDMATTSHSQDDEMTTEGHYVFKGEPLYFFPDSQEEENETDLIDSYFVSSDSGSTMPSFLSSESDVADDLQQVTTSTYGNAYDEYDFWEYVFSSNESHY